MSVANNIILGGLRCRITFDLREGARWGYVTTPRLYLCGRPVTITGGHFFWCNQAVDGGRTARELIKDGADHGKVMASRGRTTVTDNRKPAYSVEELGPILVLSCRTPRACGWVLRSTLSIKLVHLQHQLEPHGEGSKVCTIAKVCTNTQSSVVGSLSVGIPMSHKEMCL